MKVLISSHSYQLLASVYVYVYIKLVIFLVGVRLYIVVFVWISLMASYIEHLFICLLVISISFFRKYLFKHFAYYLIGNKCYLNGNKRVVSLFVVQFKYSLYILDTKDLSNKYMIYKYFSHSVCHLFTFLCVWMDMNALWWTNFLFLRSLMYLSFSVFIFCCLCFWYHTSESIAKSRVISVFL